MILCLELEVVTQADDVSIGVVIIILCLITIEEVELVLLAQFDVGSDCELPLIGLVVESATIFS